MHQTWCLRCLMICASMQLVEVQDFVLMRVL